MNKEEITINFVGITDYLKDKDIEIEHLRYENNGRYQEIQRLQNLIDKTTNYYLKELSQCSHMDDVAVEMFNLLEENKR